MAKPLQQKKKGPKGPNPIDVVKPKAKGKDEISEPHVNGNKKRERDSSDDEEERGQDTADRESSAHKRRKRRRKSIAVTTQ